MDNSISNNTILSVIKNYLDKHPEIRFQQALQNLNIVKRNGFSIVDSFYETSADTLKSMAIA